MYTQNTTSQSRKIARICRICGQQFYIFPSLIAFWGERSGQFCSRACQGLAMRRSVLERFWENVWKTATCWLWLGAYRGKYGTITNDGKPVYVHRLSWEIHYGPIPDGLSVLHHCDNTCCVRPDELFLGTSQDNTADMVYKGRQSRGERCHTAILTEEQVRYIREHGLVQQEVMKRFGISQSAASALVRGKTWRHISGSS